MRFSHFFCLLLLCLVATRLIHCTPGVSGVETTNGKVAVVQYADGSNAAFAKVRIVAYSDWYSRKSLYKNVVLDSITADKNGSISFKSSWPSYVSIEIESRTESSFKSGIPTSFDSVADTFTLAPYGSLSGEIADSLSDIVFLSGTSYTIQVNKDDNTFYFPNVPIGNYAILVPQRGENQDQSITFGTSVKIDSHKQYETGLIVPTDTLWLSDFDNYTMECALRPITKGGLFYNFDDAVHGGLSKTSLIFDNYPNGKCIRLDATLKENSSFTPYAGIGLFIGNKDTVNYEFFDLSSLKEIVFKAKGPCSLDVNISTKEIPDGDRYNYCLRIDEEWKEYTIPAESLKSLISSWEYVATHVNIINFCIVPDSGTTYPVDFSLYLDDVRLTGVTIDQLMSGK